MKPKYSNPLLPRLLGVGFASLITLSGFATSAEIAYRTAATSTDEATDAANWGDGTVAPGASDIAAWTTAGFNGESRGGSINVASPVSWGGARFEDSSGPLTLGGSPITLGASGITEVRWEAITIGNNIVLGADQTWTVGSNSLTIQGDLSGAFNLTKAGGNTLNLDGAANSFSGTLLATAGTVNITNLFGGSITQSGGTVNIDNSVDGNVSVSGGTLTNLGGIAGTLTVSGGTVVNDADVVGAVDITGGTVTHFFDFLDSVTVGGTGSLAMDSLSTVGGNLTVNAGGTVSGENEITGDLVLAGGTLVVDGASSGAILASNIDISSASTVTINGVPSGGSPIIIAEYLTSVTGLGNLSLNGSSFRSPVFSDSGSAIELAFTSGTRTWDNTSTDGLWNTGSSANWVEGDNLFFNGDDVVFGDAAPGTVTMSGVLSPGSVSFTNTTGNDYTLAGGTDGRLSGGTGVSVSGGGVVTLGGVNGQNYTGAISVTNGSTLKMGSRDAFGQSSGITVESGSTVDVNGQTPGAVATGGYEYTIAGTGVGGAGAITNTGAANFSNAGVKSVILSGDATINTNVRFDIGFANQAGGGVIEGNGFTLTKEGTGDMGFRGDGSGSAINIIVNGGNVWAENEDTAFGGATGTVTVNGTSNIGTYGDRTIATPINLGATAGLNNLGGGTGTWTGTITAAGPLNVNTGGNIVLDGEIVGTGDLVRTGGNALYLQATATSFSGKIKSESGGTLRIESNAALGTATGADVLTLGGGVTLQGGTFALQGSATIGSATKGITTTGNVNFGAGAGNTITIDGAVTGTGNLQKNDNAGDAVIFNQPVSSTLSNFTSLNGTTEFNQGLTLTWDLDQAKLRTANGNNLKLAGTSNFRELEISTATVNIGTGADVTYEQLEMSQGGGAQSVVNQTGGTVNFTGTNNSNNTSASFLMGHWGSGSSSTYNLSGGELNAHGAEMSLGWDSTNVQFNISGGTANFLGVDLNNGRNNPASVSLTGGRLNLGGSGITNASSKTVSLGSATVGAFANWSSSKPMTLAGNTVFDTLDSEDSTTPRTITLTGALDGSGSLDKQNDGSLVLDNAAGTFTGTAKVSGGSLYVNSGAAAAATLEAAAGGALRVGTVAATGTATAPTLNMNGGDATFRIGASADLVTVTDLNISAPSTIGVIATSEITGPFPVTYTVIDYTNLTGSVGDLTFVPANPHLGGTLVNDAVNTQINVEINSADTIIWKGNVNGDWDVNTTANWVLASDGVTPSNYYDFDVVELGDLGIAQPTVTLSGTIQPASTVVSNTSGTYTLQGSGISSGSLAKTGAGALVLLNNNTYPGTTSITGGSVTVGSGGTTGSLGGTGSVTVSGASLTFNRSDTINLGRSVVGGGTLVKNGSGTLRLGAAGNNVDITVNNGFFQAYDGAWATGYFSTANRQVVINGGTFQTNVHGLGGLGGGYNRPDITINTGGTWQLNGEQYMNAGDIILNGGTILSSINDLRLQGGTMVVSATAGGSSITGNITTLHATPVFDVADGAAAADLTISTTIGESGARGITKSGDGTMVITGTNNTTGASTINAGVLQIGDASTTGSLGTGAVTNNATLRFNRSDAHSIANAISGTGNVEKNGTGTMTVSGVNTYTGDTVVNAGTLQLADNAQLRFAPGANGVSNKVTGTGGLELLGDFNIDLTGADLTDGNSWTLVDVGTLGETFLSTFTVVGFTESANVHTLVDGPNTWTFDESTGVLSLSVAAGYSTWAATNAPTGTAADDYDGDGVTNGVEWLLGGDALTNDIGKLPTVSSDATSLTFTFVCDEDALTSADTSAEIEVGTTLAGWPTVFTVPTAPVANNPGVTVVDNTDGTFTVTLVVLKAADTEKFARLKVMVD